VILDAGSSGTRVHIYKWLDAGRAQVEASRKELQSLPKLITKKKWTLKERPGISTFGDKPTAVGREYLKKLFDHALTIIPKEQIRETPIFLMATAGMRLLPEVQRQTLLNEICRYAQSTAFLVPDCDIHIQVIPGETEGLYGWIAANYLLGGFDSPQDHQHGKGHHTYGFLDMGGASAQIAFAPNATEAERHAEDLKLLRMRTLDGKSSEYRVFTTTWLGFGMQQARLRYIQALEKSKSGAGRELLDPCLPSGVATSIDGQLLQPSEVSGRSEPYLRGTGHFKECLAKTIPLLGKDTPCEDEPCLMHGQHAPAIDFDVNHFVGVSEYWHTTHEIFEMGHKDKPYDFTAYQNQVLAFCGQRWSDIKEGVQSQKWGDKVTEQTAAEVCFKSSWLINVLHVGVGVPRIAIEQKPGNNGTGAGQDQEKQAGYLAPFQAVDKIDGTEVSWTLGKMVLYASGQVPPHDGALAVGFGSNIASGIPDDFQYAGSNSTHWPTDGMKDDDNDDHDLSDIAEDLLDNHKKSTSSFLLFLFILAFICYIFRKRDRRKKLYKKFNQTFRRSSSRNRRPGSPRTQGLHNLFGASKLFGRNSSQYERVLEEGDAANDFELQDVDSDDNEHSDSSASDGSRLARSTGAATPKLNVSFSDSHSYFEPSKTHGGSVGMGLGLPNAMDRSGLVVRTESRERLGPTLQMLGAGRRSRTGSPVRGKSPLAPSLED
jgi:Golgi apyrase